MPDCLAWRTLAPHRTEEGDDTMQLKIMLIHASIDYIPAIRSYHVVSGIAIMFTNCFVFVSFANDWTRILLLCSYCMRGYINLNFWEPEDPPGW